MVRPLHSGGRMERTETRSTDNRSGDRRSDDRRRLERRAPPPPWRRPWAFAAYGALGAAILVAMLMPFSGRGSGRGDPPIVEKAPATLPAEPATRAAAPAPVEPAYGAAGFEQLMLEGPSAVGRRVLTELYCEQPGSYQVRAGVTPEAAVAALATNGRVPAAECKWGGPSDPRREDFVLLVPPALAEQFASTPVVNDQFQRRRRVAGEVEWIGRSEALALRPAGVFRGLIR